MRVLAKTQPEADAQAMSDVALWIFLGALAILALFFGGIILLGSIAVFPLAAAAAFVGWLIGGSVGALIGLIISGIVGWMYVKSRA